MNSSLAAGWYGKLPSLGDFAQRRLDPGFIEAWDHWLAEELAAWREREPEEWLRRYLASPSWRFLIAPGTLPGPAGRLAWAGALMPSVDRVGRYFPLTLVMPLPALPADDAEAGALLCWLQQLDDLALDALDEEWNAEQLEAELQRLGSPAAAGEAHGLDLPPLIKGQALWIHADATGEPQPRTSDGLPRGLAFAALLGAS